MKKSSPKNFCSLGIYITQRALSYPYHIYTSTAIPIIVIQNLVFKGFIITIVNQIGQHGKAVGLNILHRIRIITPSDDLYAVHSMHSCTGIFNTISIHLGGYYTERGYAILTRLMAR
jgi:hypothetical protein